MLGASLALILGYVYVKLYTSLDTTMLPNKSLKLARLNSKIMEIPAVKEFQPVTKFEVSFI